MSPAPAAAPDDPPVPPAAGARRPLPATTQFEVLPIGQSVADEVAAVAPVRLTVTCSPRHGVDVTVAVAARHAALGCTAIPHLAARGVRDEAHLDTLLRTMRDAGIDEAFVIGGDAPEALGPYASGVALLEAIAAHELRPARLGVAAYPEGHPHIPDDALREALRVKAGIADYLVTQLCFDASRLVDWLAATRDGGVALPAVIGLPGAVDRRKLLEVSAKVGVGDSLRFLRKQSGMLRLLTGRASRVSENLLSDMAGPIADPALGVSGLHLYTFNRLAATHAWEQDLRRR
jgi:methylenetetrahydrofolate reductase (NADPH)